MEVKELYKRQLLLTNKSLLNMLNTCQLSMYTFDMVETLMNWSVWGGPFVWMCFLRNNGDTGRCVYLGVSLFPKSMSASLKGIFANAKTRSSGVLMAKQKLRLLGFSCLQQVYFSGMECSLLLTECWLF